MAKESKGVLGKGESPKGNEAERILKKMDSESVNKRYAAAQIEGGENLTVDGPGSGRKANGVVKVG